MKTKKKKVRSPAVYKYTKKKSTERLPQLLDKKIRLENKIVKMEKYGAVGLPSVRGSLKRVMEDIADIESRDQLILSAHFINRWKSRVCVEDNEEQIMNKLKEARIDYCVKTLGNGSYPYMDYYVICNEWVCTTIINPSVPKDKEI